MMNIEQKRRYLTVALHPWTDGVDTRTYSRAYNAPDRVSLWKAPAGHNEDEVPLTVSVDELLERWTPVTAETKYAVGDIMDQTCGYWAGDEEGFTVEHPKAVLFDTIDEAEAQIVVLRKEWEANLRASVAKPDSPFRDTHQRLLDEKAYATAMWVEAVANVEEFRSREDTW